MNTYNRESRGIDATQGEPASKEKDCLIQDKSRGEKGIKLKVKLKGNQR